MSQTETQKQIQIILLGSFLIGLGLLMVPWHASANTFVSLYQQLRPQACTPTMHTTPSGEQTFSVAEGCGQLVLPGAPSNELYRQPSYKMAIPFTVSPVPPTKILYGNELVYLESDPAKQPTRGYMLLTELYARYGFYLTGDNRAIAPRSMQIVAIGTHVVVVQFAPGSERYALAVGKHVDIDLNDDGAPDIALRLQQIGSDGAVLLHVAFPPQPAAALTTASEDTFAYLASVMAFSSAALLLYSYLQNVYLRKHALPPPTWWGAHVHEPYAGAGDGPRAWHTPNHPHYW